MEPDIAILRMVPVSVSLEGPGLIVTAIVHMGGMVKDVRLYVTVVQKMNIVTQSMDNA